MEWLDFGIPDHSIKLMKSRSSQIQAKVKNLWFESIRANTVTQTTTSVNNDNNQIYIHNVLQQWLVVHTQNKPHGQTCTMGPQVQQVDFLNRYISNCTSMIIAAQLLVVGHQKRYQRQVNRLAYCQ